jgi:hypothetical protein
MKIFPKKTKYEILKELGYAADVYINRIHVAYNMDSNIDNLVNVTDFLKRFTSLSKEDFIQEVENVGIGKQSFCLLHALVNGSKGAVEMMLHNKKATIKPEDMDDFVKYMQNSAKTRLEKAIEQFDEMIDERNKENKIQSMKN